MVQSRVVYSIFGNQFGNLPSSTGVFCSSRGGVVRRAVGADAERSTMTIKYQMINFIPNPWSLDQYDNDGQ